MTKTPRTLFHAAAIADSTGLHAAPGAILLQGDTILAAGAPAKIGQPSHTTHRSLPHHVLIPALVNTHCHLDLTHIGPIPYTGEFDTWVDIIEDQRATDDKTIRSSVLHGVELSRAGGTALIGDIAGVGSLAPLAALRESEMAGTSYLEVFGLGRDSHKTSRMLRKVVGEVPAVSNNVRFGLQPHAPYSCGIEVYREAVQLNRPLATHLAETLEEIEFVQSATGPIVELFKRRTGWDGTLTGTGVHPVDHLANILAEKPFIAAHLNYISEKHLQLLAQTDTTIAYCPRASAYFGHPHREQPSHQYRRMIDAGINVALATDSILCLDTPDRISVLDEMRFLFQRDATDPATLLKMATTNGAAALGDDQSKYTLTPGKTAGIIAIKRSPQTNYTNPILQALQADTSPTWVHRPRPHQKSPRRSIENH